MPGTDRAETSGRWRPTGAGKWLKQARGYIAGHRTAPAADGVSGAGAPEILFVALADGLGGSMRSLATVLEHLDGFARVVACPNSSFVTLIKDKGCVDEWLELPNPHGNRIVKRLRTAIVLASHAARRRKSLLAIHANGLSERTVVALAAAISRRPVVVWVHEWKVSPWSSRLNRTLTRVIPRTYFVGVSEFSRDVLVAAGITSREGVDVVPNPIDPDQVARSGNEAREPDQPCAVGYLGTPAKYKGFHLLPQLIRATEDIPAHWLIYSGPRTMMSDVWAELESLSPEMVTLRGKTPDVSEAYASCDIICCPSFEESFGRVAVEAMASGVPVVASDLPALREVVGSDAGGILVPPGDVDAMAVAIRRLCEDVALRDDLAARGRIRAQKYEPGGIAEHFACLYRRAAQSAR